MWAWGTYRDASGVMGFSKHTRIQVGVATTCSCTSRNTSVHPGCNQLMSGAACRLALPAARGLDTMQHLCSSPSRLPLCSCHAAADSHLHLRA